MPYQYAGNAATSGSNSVAFSANGLVMAVGDTGYDDAISNRGAVRVYDLVSGVWTQRGYLVVGSDSVSNSGFGSSVDLSGDGTTLVVGSNRRPSGGTFRGGVYVFDISSTSFAQRGGVLVSADVVNHDAFGQSVAVSYDGNTLVVGAVLKNASAIDYGSVYTYDRNGSAWTQRGSKITAQNQEDFFGWSVSLTADGNTLAVGAVGYDNGGISSSGATYIYDRSGSTWTQRGTVVTPPQAVAGDTSGSGVALSGDGMILAIGAEYTSSSAGAVYIYDRNGSAWTQRDTITKSGSIGLGISLAIVSNSIIAIDQLSTAGGILFYTIGRSPVYAGSLTFTRPENGTAVGTATFTDPDGDVLTYTLSGADASKFTITSAGALSFNTAPNFENPTDAG